MNHPPQKVALKLGNINTMLMTFNGHQSVVKSASSVAFLNLESELSISCSLSQCSKSFMRVGVESLKHGMSLQDLMRFNPSFYICQDACHLLQTNRVLSTALAFA